MYTIICPKCEGKEQPCELCNNERVIQDSRGCLETSCLQDNLAKSLKILNKVKVNRTYLPVLEGVLIETRLGRLALTRTNLVTGIRVYCGTRVDRDGAFVADFDTLNAMVSKLSPERIDLKLNRRKNELMLECGASHLDIAGFDPGEYPTLDLPKDARTAAVVNSDALVRALAETLPSAATEDERPLLKSVHFTCDGETLTLVAADGKEMSVSPIKLTEKVEPFDVTVETESLGILASILKSKDYQNVEVSLTIIDAEKYGAVRFCFGAWGAVELFAQTIDGQYPDWREVLDLRRRKIDREGLLVDAAEFATALDRASVIAKHTAEKWVKLTGTAPEKQGVLHVESWAKGKGHYDGILSMRCETRGLSVFGCNSERLAGAVKRMAQGRVMLHIDTLITPMLVTFEGSESMYLLMPVKLDQEVLDASPEGAHD